MSRLLHDSFDDEAQPGYGLHIQLRDQGSHTLNISFAEAGDILSEYPEVTFTLYPVRTIATGVLVG